MDLLISAKYAIISKWETSLECGRQSAFAKPEVGLHL